MEHRQLRYAVAVADAQSFSKAAALVHVAQSAISHQIAALESEVGFSIFERGHGYVRVTELGVEFIARARGIVRQLEALGNGQLRRDIEPSGELAVGFPGSLRSIAALAFARFRTSFPKVLLKVEQGTTAQLRDSLLSHRLDIALVSDIEKLPGLTSHKVAREQLYLVGPRESDLSEKTPLKATSLFRYPQIATPPLNSLRIVLDKAASKGRRGPPIVAEVTGTDMILDLVELGLGFTVLPGCAFQSRLAAHRLRAAPLERQFIGWVIAEVRGAPNATLASLLRAEILQTAAQQVELGAWRGAALP